MEKNLLAVVVTIAFSLLGVLGDYFLKLASANENSLKTTSFYIAFVLYASTAFGWVFVMKHLKLATIGVVYSVSMVLLLTTVGVVFFRESLNTLGHLFGQKVGDKAEHDATKATGDAGKTKDRRCQ